MRGCEVKGCLELAKYVPVIKVKVPGNDTPFALDFTKIAICQTHKDRFTLKDIVTDKMLGVIQRMFYLTNLAQPEREHMELDWNLDSFQSSVPLYDTNGKALGNIPVTNKEKGIKIT